MLRFGPENRSTRAPAILLAGCCLLLAQAGIAATLLVPQEHATIQAGIDLAQPGDTVLVAPGTYRGIGNRDLDFYGKDIALVGSGGSAATIIDCDAAGRGLHLASGETQAALVQGITIQNGSLPDDQCGGILCRAGATFRDVVVRQCFAQYAGGVLIEGSGDPILMDCVIEDNQNSAGSGGGIAICNGSTAILSNVVIRGNYSHGRGGGAYMCFSSPQFFNVTFEDNEAISNGGGVYYTSSPVCFKDCLFIRNHARNGGGLDTGVDPGLFEDCAFIENTALQTGGGICIESDEGTVFRNCLMLRNTAGAGGGVYVGEYMAYPPVQFINCSFIANDCLWVAGSAMTANWQGKADLVNCLVTGNSGGVALWTHYAAINVSCSDVWGNPSGNYGGELTDETGLDGNISLDPFLCDTGADNFTLAEGSPCLPENNGCSVQMGAFGMGCTLTAIEQTPPAGLTLGANYPNPFNPATTIPFALANPAEVTLSILDVTGRLVRDLCTATPYAAGQHELRWDGQDGSGRPVPSGVYFYRLSTTEGATARPMLLLK
ncbi:MAG: right-handed parallel beta-helix repeat-containing protein [Candidatus Krumholzibacteriia bacterium]|nr:right-handed parallel beta-helix repeat-containing protein [bacterium]MCB9515447.1 right-handed parallel beta-helix repeat-containing protein [Candidatus Latescibacterota bacterium]